MNIEITYKKLQEIAKAANSIPAQDEEKRPYKDTLAKYLIRLRKKLAHHFEDYKDEVEDIDIKHCLKNEKGAIVFHVENGAYQRTEAHVQARRKELATLGQKKIFIEPCICGDMKRVNDLPLWVLDELDGILFNAPKDLELEGVSQNGAAEKPAEEANK